MSGEIVVFPPLCLVSWFRSSAEANTTLAATASDFANDPVATAKEHITSKISEMCGTSGKSLWLYLIDEGTGTPVVDESGVYPIEIGVRDPAAQQKMTKLLPAMNIGLKVMKVASTGGALARCFGIPAPSVPKALQEKAEGFVDAAGTSNTVAGYDCLQEAVGLGGSEEKQDVRGAGLREFESFLLERDTGKTYLKLLERVQNGKEIMWVRPGSMPLPTHPKPSGSTDSPRTNQLSEQRSATMTAPSISDWSVDQLANWLEEKFKLEEVAKSAREEEVTGSDAAEFDKDAWKELGASAVKAGKIVAAIKKML